MKSCKLRMRVKFNILIDTNKYIPLVSCMHLQLIHILALSSQVMVYIAWVLAKRIQVWNQDFLQLWYGVRVVQTTLQAFFRSTITGIVVQLQGTVLEALLYLLPTRVIRSSHVANRCVLIH